MWQAKMAAFCWIFLDIIFALKPLYASGMYSFYRSVQKVIGIKVFILIFLVVFVLETNRQWQFSLAVSL